MVSDVISSFGGIRPMARLLGVPVSTVANWKTNGIPSWRWPQIEAARAALRDFQEQRGQ